MLDFKKSMKLHERALKVIPGGTNSAARANISSGMCENFAIHYPKVIERAEGSHIYDVDGNSFVDYNLAMGPVILGHAHPEVTEAVREQLLKGCIYGINNEMELEVSEKITRHVPCADMVLVMNTGSDATSAALRIARAYTGKQWIVRFEGHYHGWHDWSIFHNYSAARLDAAGIPRSVQDGVILLPWNDLEAVQKLLVRRGHEIAAVITEPYMFNMGAIPPKEGYLEGLRKITSEKNVVLIFDEIITGFRLGLSGAQGMLGVTPDMATFAKALANGFPISAVAGKRDIMEHIRDPGETWGVKLWLAGTYNSNPVSMAAALATLKELEKEASYSHLYEIGKEIMRGISDVVEDAGVEAVVQGPGPGFTICFTELDEITNPNQIAAIPAYPHIKRAIIFFQEMLNRGIFVLPGRVGRMYVSLAHTEEDIDRTIQAAEESAKEAKNI